MVLKFGKRGIYSGNTFKTPCCRYLRQYRNCSYVTRKDVNVKGDDIAGEKFGINDIRNRDLEYSLNKKGRWLLPNILIDAIKAGQFDSEDYGVQLFEKHNISDKYANCVSAYFSTGTIRETTVFRQTGKRKHRKSGYMCLYGLKNRNSGIVGKKKRHKYSSTKYISQLEQEWFVLKPEKREITYEVVYPSSLHSLLTHSYRCIGDTKIEKITDKRPKNKMLRRFTRDIIQSDISCFLEESDISREHSDVDLDDSFDDITYKHTETLEVKDFLLHALSNSSVKQAEPDSTFNDYVFVPTYQKWLAPSEPADKPVRVILDHIDTNKGRLAEVYGNKYIECQCSPRKFIIDISQDVMAFDVFSREWKMSVKQVHACVVFVHDIENEINTTENQIYKIYLNSSLNTEMEKLRISTLFEYIETNVEDSVNRTLFFIESLPKLVQFREHSYSKTRMAGGFENLYGWRSRNYIPDDEYHFNSFMAACQTSAAGSATEDENCTIQDFAEFGKVCGICFDEISVQSCGTALSQCGHWFCDDCWEEHLKMKLKSGSIHLDCPEHSCKSEIDYGTLLSILCIEDVIKFTKFRHDLDVNRKNDTKWCPNVRCGRVLVRHDPVVAVVQCDCGHKVCFECLGPAHWPAPCQSVKPYQRLLREVGVKEDDVNTTSLLPVFGMHCPNCNRFFEKIDGCPRMTCLCQRSFCWGCGKDWSSYIHDNRCETLGKKVIHIDLTCRFLYSASLQNEWIDAALEHRLYQQPHKTRRLRSKAQHIAKALIAYMNKSSSSITLHFKGLKRGYTKESQKIPEFLENLLMINSELHFIAENIALFLGSDIRATTDEYFKFQLKKLTFYCRSIEECLNEPVQSAMSRLRRLKEMRSVSLNLIKTLVAYIKPEVSKIDVVDGATADLIVRKAQTKIGKTKWSYKSSWVTGRNTNKCNIFVADVLKEARANAPERWPARILKYAPIGAQEWANPGSSYLTGANCWNLCRTPKRGDVIAKDGHVGIVTGNKRTTSANDKRVVENDWGFRPGSKPTCWRYQYFKQGC